MEPTGAEEDLDRPPVRPRLFGGSHWPGGRLARGVLHSGVQTGTGGRPPLLVECTLPPPIAMKLGSAWLFDVGAVVYAGMNAQRAWLGSCARLAAHFPPAIVSPRVLDLGCGPGFSAVALARIRPDATLVGLDLAPRMLGEARRYVARSGVGQRVQLIRADAARLPFGDQAFDVVTGHSFLYLVDRPTEVLAEARRVLRPGGRVVLMEPAATPPGPGAVLRHSVDPRFLFSVALWRPYSRRHGRFSPATFEATLASAGLEQFGCEPVLAGLGLIGWAARP